MVAYSFNKMFVSDIQAFRKTHTIRANGKRPHARKGQTLQLFCGMRTAQCFKIIDDQICALSDRIEIDVADTHIRSISSPFGHAAGDDIHDFAYTDGFEDGVAMHRFWLQNHGPGLFRGTLISWNGAYA